MKLNLFFLLFTLPVAVVSQHTDEQMKRFYNWMQDFKVEYNNGKEFVKRFHIYLENDKYINSVNSQNLSYSLEHNQFSHYTNEEFSELNNLNEYSTLKQLPSVKTDLLHTKRVLGEVGDFDWTTKGAVTDVKDQKQCGSCWAFSTTGSLEGIYYLKNGHLESFSEQMLVDCDTNDYGCGGGLMNNAFQWIQDNGGIEKESDYPYTATGGVCKEKTGEIVEGTAPTTWVNVESSNDALLSAIQQQPVSVAIEADQTTFQFYSSGVLTGKCGTNLDHGVLAVGYGTLDGVDYYKIKNSWGKSWGMDGYVLLERKDVRGGQCGILLSASYPTLD
jgi:C1A family cysteine protease